MSSESSFAYFLTPLMKPCIYDVCSIVAEYDGRKYVKVESSYLTNIWNIFKSNPLNKALEEENIKLATKAIQEHGWSDSNYTQILSLAEKGKWKSVEFIFAQLETDHWYMTDSPHLFKTYLGSSEYHRRKWEFNLGIPAIQADHFIDYFPYSPDIHPNSFFVTGPNHFSVRSELYFKLIDIWKRYHLFSCLGEDVGHSSKGSKLFVNAVKSHDYRIAEIFFSNGLSVDNIKHSLLWSKPNFFDNFYNFAEDRKESELISLAAWSALDNDCRFASWWLKAGLDPNSIVYKEKVGEKREVSWLIAMVCCNNVKGVQILLEHGANPEIMSYSFEPIQQSRRTVRIKLYQDRYDHREEGNGLAHWDFMFGQKMTFSLLHEQNKMLPIERAKQLGHEEIVQLLSGKGK